MTTTVTTTTVTTVTAMGLTATLGLVATLALIACLAVKQLAASGPEDRSIQWGRTLNIGIIPLLLAFAVIVAVKLSTLS